MSYKIKIETFEGPFDLLLHLVDKNQVDIYDIPINEITDQYIAHIRLLDEIDLELTSEFLLMAATLIEIKSRMLLPINKSDLSTLSAEELDPRSELVRRMLEYKKYKEVSYQFKLREEYAKRMYSKKREEIIFEDNSNNELNDIDLDELIIAFNKLILRHKTSTKNNTLSKNFRNIQRETVTIEEKIDDILRLLEENNSICFNNIFSLDTTKIELITTFLALLELMKQKKIMIKQDISFSQILIMPYPK